MPIPLPARNTSKKRKNSVQEPVETVEPVPETHLEDVTNIPYRGAAHHGVKSTRDIPDDVELSTAINEDDVDPWEHALEPEAPIAVRVVTSGASEMKEWRTLVGYSRALPAQLVGRHESRNKITVRNVGGNTCYLSHDPSVLNISTDGYPLADGAEIDLNTTQPIYCVSNGTDSKLVMVEEYTVKVPA